MAGQSPEKNGGDGGFGDKQGISVKDIVKSGLRQQDWGIDHYEVPTRPTFERPRTNQFSRSKYKSFVDDEVKARSWVPGYQYNSQQSWATNKYTLSAKFKPFDRKTMTVEIINKANKLKIPGTGCYDGANKSLIEARKLA